MNKLYFKAKNRSNPFRWGILGTGWMAGIFAKELRLHPEAEISAVASKGPARAAAFANEHWISRHFDSYQALVNCDDVDIVYDATTNNHHFENVLAALWARKPMLVEKPICRSVAELDQLIEAYERQPAFLMEAMWMRCFPIIRNLKQTVSRIEPLISMEASFGNEVPFDPNHRLFNPDLGGGAMLDIGIYPLNLAHLLFGLSDCKITADISRAETGVDDTVSIDLAYPGGLTAHLFCSFSKATPHRAVFKGQKGVLTIEDFFHPSKVTLTTADRHETLAEPEYPIMGYNFEIDEVHRALRAGETESPLMPLAHSREVLWVIERFLSTRSLRV